MWGLLVQCRSFVLQNHTTTDVCSLSTSTGDETRSTRSCSLSEICSGAVERLLTLQSVQTRSQIHPWRSSFHTEVLGNWHTPHLLLEAFLAHLRHEKNNRRSANGFHTPNTHTHTRLLLEKPLTHLNTHGKVLSHIHTEPLVETILKGAPLVSHTHQYAAGDAAVSSVSPSSLNQACACFFTLCPAGAPQSIPPWLHELLRACENRSRFKRLSPSNFTL